MLTNQKEIKDLNSKKIEHLDLYRPDKVLRGRHEVKMKLQYFNEGKVLRSPYYLMVNLWNQLDVKLQTIEILYIPRNI